jgi:DNA helicase HerA-like ATPase
MGKTSWLKRYLKSVRRGLILDPVNEYDRVQKFDHLDVLIEHVLRYRIFRVRTEWETDFPLLCATAKAAGNCTLVIDEAQRVVPPRGDVPATFEDIVYRGRHRGVSLAIAAQRPSTVHLVARSQWSRLITFRQTEPNDVRWIEDTTGYSLPLTDLEPLTFYEITPTGIYRKHLTFGREGAIVEATVEQAPSP